MKKSIISVSSVLFFTFLLVSSVSAQQEDLMSSNISEVSYDGIDLNNLKTVFNQNTERVPDFASSLLGDQTVEINLGEGLESNRSSIGFRMKEMQITDINWGGYNDTKLSINVSRENLETILSADSPLNRAGKMLETGELEYEALTFGNKVRLGLFKIFTGL